MKSIFDWVQNYFANIKRRSMTVDELLRHDKHELEKLDKKSGCMCGHFEWCDGCSPSSSLNVRRKKLRSQIALWEELSSRSA